MTVETSFTQSLVQHAKKSNGENGIGDSKLRDRVVIYRQHIRQPEHEKLKVEKHLRICGKGNFTIFPFLGLRSNDTDLRPQYKDYKEI